MKIATSALCVGILWVGQVSAEMQDQGLSGELGFLSGITSIKSNFHVENEVKKSPLNSEGESDSIFVFLPLGQVRYQADNHQFFLGSSEEDIIKGVVALELGYRNQLTTNSEISFSYLPTIVTGETWQDPYQTGVRRDKTDVKGDAYRFKYEYLSLVTDLAYYDREVETERSGNSLAADTKLLARDGDGYFARIALGLPFSDSTFVEPAVFYRKDSADGKAMAFDRVGGGLTFVQMFGESLISFNTRYSSAKFDAVNPIFNRKREDDSLDVTIAFEYGQAFGIPSLSITSILNYGRNDSNIDFYNEENYAAMLGSTIRF